MRAGPTGKDAQAHLKVCKCVLGIVHVGVIASKTASVTVTETATTWRTAGLGDVCEECTGQDLVSCKFKGKAGAGSLQMLQTCPAMRTS
eukprot:359194-Chlamydomonas_euryale.AAC.7